jgi:acyl-CoA synthetase (AMP-forming)/AMP-acid ligase II
MANQIAAKQDGMQTLVVDPDFPLSADAQFPSPNIESIGNGNGDPKTKPLSDAEELDPIRWIFYTSGTTADPKGVMHCDRSLLAGAKGMGLALELTPADRIAFVFPITHVGGIQWLQASLVYGCTLILIDDFAHRETIPTLRNHGVTLATAGTVFHEAYLAAQRRSPDSPLFPAIRGFPGGGAPKPPQLHHDLRREMGGVGILSGYGSTEAPILSMSRMDDPSEKLAATEGRPSLPDVELRVVGPDDKPVAEREVGELRVRGPQLFSGYVDSSLNIEAFDEDGFFKTGDLGYLDDDGYVVVTGRLKDIIIRKGENISAKEVEDLLYEHPKIVEVAVIGLPDPRTGERCCAVVTCQDPGTPIRFKEMTEFLRGRQLMIQRIPEQLEIVDTMPRNATGKILKHELRERFGR